MLKRTILGLICLVALASCMSPRNAYVQPTPQQPGATISNYWNREGTFTAVWTGVDLTLVDKLPVVMSQDSARVAPGDHLLQVSARFNLGFGSGGPFTTMAEVPATLKDGQRYTVKGKPDGLKLQLWVESDEGVAAGPVVSVSYGVEPQAAAMPIFIYSK